MTKSDSAIVGRGRNTTSASTKSRRPGGASPAATTHRELYGGFIRLHLLHHAVKESVYGFAMIEELRRHGYELSAGTLYPILHGLEKKGLLRSTRKRVGGVERRIYRATPTGRRALSVVKARVRELFGELFEEEGGGS